MVETNTKHFNDLTLDEFHDIIALRISVFVVEQDCPYQDLDGLDKDAYHLYIKHAEKIVATCRILKAGVAYHEVAIGRVVSDQEHRHLKLGHELMKAAKNFVFEKFGNVNIKLGAQTHLTKFYNSHGFVSTGKEYLEDGIPHTEMILKTNH